MKKKAFGITYLSKQAKLKITFGKYICLLGVGIQTELVWDFYLELVWSGTSRRLKHPLKMSSLIFWPNLFPVMVNQRESFPFEILKLHGQDAVS